MLLQMAPGAALTWIWDPRLASRRSRWGCFCCCRRKWLWNTRHPMAGCLRAPQMIVVVYGMCMRYGRKRLPSREMLISCWLNVVKGTRNFVLCISILRGCKGTVVADSCSLLSGAGTYYSSCHPSIVFLWASRSLYGPAGAARCTASSTKSAVLLAMLCMLYDKQRTSCGLLLRLFG